MQCFRALLIVNSTTRVVFGFSEHVFLRTSLEDWMWNTMMWCPNCTVSSQLERKLYANTFLILIHGNLPNAKMAIKWKSIQQSVILLLIVLVKNPTVFRFSQILQNCPDIVYSFKSIATYTSNFFSWLYRE